MLTELWQQIVAIATPALIAIATAIFAWVKTHIIIPKGDNVHKSITERVLSKCIRAVHIEDNGTMAEYMASVYATMDNRLYKTLQRMYNHKDGETVDKYIETMIRGVLSNDRRGT